MPIKLVITGCKLYSSIKGEFVLLKFEQLQHIITSSMKNQGTLIQQSLQNPNRQIVQSCIQWILTNPNSSVLKLTKVCSD